MVKVVFAKMAKENAHLLLLDEPTNALDMEMIDSLANAIKQFKGGVLLVSHDMRLISQANHIPWETIAAAFSFLASRVPLAFSGHSSMFFLIISPPLILFLSVLIGSQGNLDSRQGLA